MKNKRLTILLTSLLGLLLIIVCGCGSKKSVNIPISLFQNTGDPVLSLSETSHSFTGVVVNNNADREFTITNTGSGGLGVSGITSNATEFTITSQNCTTQSLGNNKSCTFIVRFSPKSQGTFTGAISVVSNDPPVRTVAVSGDGYGLNVWINQVDFSTCSDVTLDVTVTDTTGPILNLNIGDHFRLWQNGAEQDITSVSTIENPDPVSVVIALDLSGSLTASINTIKTHAKYFVGELSAEDKAAIYKFRQNINYHPDASFVIPNGAGKDELKAYIDGTQDLGPDGTALYLALYESITRAATETTNKKAVVVLSDGNNENSTARTLVEVINHAKDLQVPIFTIYYSDPAFPYAAKPGIMKQLAEETGGQDYYSDTSTMEDIFSQIRNVLGSKYTIHYASPNCTGSIPLEVRVDWDHDNNAGTPDLYGIDSRTYTQP